jgi:hypothetical protein
MVLRRDKRLSQTVSKPFIRSFERLLTGNGINEKLFFSSTIDEQSSGQKLVWH